MSQTSFSSRFMIGIDLGTSNCAVAYFDAQNLKQSIQFLRIPQMGKHGHEEFLPLLPSSLYLEGQNEIIIGMWAKIQGAKVPTRLIQSAKSWLSNPAANRKEKILPFEAIEQSRKLSPLEASSRLLIHIRDMWNKHIAKGNPEWELEEQEVILTVPASFDEVARTLTAQAASLAGFKKITLLEEPQAAFYSWLMEHGKSELKEGDVIVVCDVGGGTTDFSLINVIATEDGIGLQRMAVGKHLLLGGDNMDAAMCHELEKRLNQELDLTQHLAFLHQVREAKEELFGNGKKEVTLFLSGKGSKVIADSVSIKLYYADAEKILLDGFFDICDFHQAIKLKRGSGIRQMGLNFEIEPSITKHLAYFLHKNGQSAKPSHVLFNGGAMKPLVFQRRIIESLDKWFEGPPVRVLTSSSLDLSVARGAAYFGMVRHNKMECIGGGTPRCYYLKVDIKDANQPFAITLLPRGAVEGMNLVCEHLFFLVPNQPVSFQLFHSNTRLNDKVGDLIPIEEEELTPLAPIQTICQYGKKEHKEPLPVLLEVFLTAIGTIDMWLLAQKSTHKWKLEFQLWGSAGEERSFDKRLSDQTYDTDALASAHKIIIDAFAMGAVSKLSSLMSDLEKFLEIEKQQWPPSVLRSFFEPILSQSDKRLLSNHYESRFWNLAGFFLRPGLGYPLDDYRIKQLWKLILNDVKKVKSDEVLIQQWICFRRIAAGLSKGQQIQLYNELIQSKTPKKGYAYAEHLRALASLELIENSSKIKLGKILLLKICSGKAEPCDYWALGRLGARQLFHGSVANVVPPSFCEEWIISLIKTPAAASDHLPFTLAMLARKTNCREIDLPTSIIEQIAPFLAGQQDLIFQERDLTSQEQERFFGDSLPSGLKLDLFHN